MLYRVAADLLAAAHLVFVAFVVLGGLLALRWPRTPWIHLPAAAWGVVITFTGWVCPLTPWENELRRAAGGQGYAGGFVEQYITAILYPEGLTRGIQAGLGVGVLVVNAWIYLWLWRRFRRVARGRSA